ncbi:MAG: hypothetical protein BWZ04_01344 [Firmicutes bacterium ADurb.BinA205]|nr:MAG: hypothetical protein BWZ04_01344 [Firmicutes bacterium ADurb.BinA205]
MTFSGLENGLYLVWGEVLYRGDTTYVPSAIFFEMCGEEANVLNAYPKIILRTLSASGARYQAKKVWMNDEDQPWNRATSITIELYRDNEYYDEATLSEENNWTYEWEDKAEHTWFVYEKDIPAGYTVNYKDNTYQYLIINTYEGETHTTTTTTETTVTTETTTATAVSTTATDTTDTTDTNSSTNKTTTTQTVGTTTITSQDNVPQTGQLWWPVPGLACSGVVMLGLGAGMRKKDDDE